jgi:hypothetical protein
MVELAICGVFGSLPPMRSMPLPYVRDVFPTSRLKLRGAEDSDEQFSGLKLSQLPKG